MRVDCEVLIERQQLEVVVHAAAIAAAASAATASPAAAPIDLT
jgi:hypothetical protein